MSAVLSREAMLTTRNLVRWIAVGTQPSQANAAAALEVIKDLDAQATTMVRRVIDEANRGILASQEACRTAEQQLQDVFVAVTNDDQERGDVDCG